MAFIRGRLISHCQNRCVDCTVHNFPLPECPELHLLVLSPYEEGFATELGESGESVFDAMHVIEGLGSSRSGHVQIGGIGGIDMFA